MVLADAATIHIGNTTFNDIVTAHHTPPEPPDVRPAQQSLQPSFWRMGKRWAGSSTSVLARTMDFTIG